MMIATPSEITVWPSKSKSKSNALDQFDDASVQSIATKNNEVEIAEYLFDLIPCNTRLRYCVDIGTRNGENFVDNTLITHSLLVSNDKEQHRRRGSENFVDNDEKYGKSTWFGVLLQPDARAFQSLQQLHQPLGNLCLQISPSVEEGLNDESLVLILRQHVSDLPMEFDFLGLHEMGYSNYWLLRDFLDYSTYRPKVVCVSFDNMYPKDVAYIPNRNDEQGLPSVMALVELMAGHGYELVVTTLRCAFFVKKELYEKYLRSRVRRHPIKGFSSISQPLLNPADGYQERRQEPEVSQNCQIISPRTYKMDIEIISSNKIPSNKAAYDNFAPAGGNKIFDKQQQSFELSKSGLLLPRTKQSSVGVESPSDTMGMKWLLQRRKMFESNGLNAATIPKDRTKNSSSSATTLNEETKSTWQKPKESPLLDREWEMKTKSNMISKVTQLYQHGNENIIPRKKTFSRAASDPPESRDDYMPSPIEYTNGREHIKDMDFIFGRETDREKMIGTVRDESELISRYFPQKMTKIIPPDPVGDIFLQQVGQANRTKRTKIEKFLEAIRTDSRSRIGNRKVEEKEQESAAPPLTVAKEQFFDKMDFSLLELKNKILMSSEDNNDRQNDKVAEDLREEVNENEYDEFVPISAATDLTAICGLNGRSSEEEKSECAKILIAELQQDGYTMICGTNISRFLCRDALYASQSILHEADESVRSSCKSEDGILRGYSPKCTEQSGSSDLKDMVRKFKLGSAEGNTPNRWPIEGTFDEETDEYIRVSLQEYHDNLHRVAVSITKSISDVFSNESPNLHDTEATLLSYNVQDPDSSLLTVMNCEYGSRHDTGKPLITSHTDTSLVTIVLVDGGDCADFQHELMEGKWESVRLPKLIPNDPVFMVYAGESLQRLSGGRIPSKSRRIVPSLGHQTVNGLMFSLMPPQTVESLSLNRELKSCKRDEEVRSPISRLTSELNEIDEFFQSYAFLEEEDLQHNFESDKREELLMMSEELIDTTGDPFVHALGDARSICRNRIQPLHSDENNSYSGDQFQISPPLTEHNPFRISRDALLAKYSDQSSKTGSFGGPETKIEEEITRKLSRETTRSGRNNCLSQLLGSPQLPIIIENKSAPKYSVQIIKIEDHFKPVALFSNENNDTQNRESIPTKHLLPVASPWNPPLQDCNQTRNDSRRTARCTKPNQAQKSPSRRLKTPKRQMSEVEKSYRSNRKKDEFVSSNNDMKQEREQEREREQNFERKDHLKENVGQNETDVVSRNEIQVQKIEASHRDVKGDENNDNVNSVQSMEASEMLEEILGDKNDRATDEQKMDEVAEEADERYLEDTGESLEVAELNDNRSRVKSNLTLQVVTSPSSRSCDPIFQACRKSLSSQHSKNAQSADYPGPPTSTNQGETSRDPSLSKDVVTANAYLYNETITFPQHNDSDTNEDVQKPWATKDKYVPFRGSEIERNMRENAKKMKNSVVSRRRGKIYNFDN